MYVVKDLVECNEQFLSIQEFNQIFNIEGCFSELWLHQLNQKLPQKDERYVGKQEC